MTHSGETQRGGGSVMIMALITGVSGHLGWYLAQELQRRNVLVYGMASPQAGVHIPGGSEAEYVRRELPQVTTIFGDLLDYSSLLGAIISAKPDLVFALGAISQPSIGFSAPELMLQVNVMGMVRLLEAVRLHCPQARFVAMSSDAIFGNALTPQNEDTPLAPRDTYALSKAMAHLAVDTARAHGRWAANAILFNASSPRQSSGFLVHVIREAVQVKLGRKERVEVQSLNF